MLNDHIVTPGLILFTQNFEACVRFYRDTLGLPLWFEKPGLCCLRLGDGYLMVETGGTASANAKSTSQNPTVLRFNVADVKAVAKQLQSAGITVEVTQFDWGVIGAFLDPDGNTCELKDAGDPFFAQDLTPSPVTQG